jgi:transposase
MPSMTYPTTASEQTYIEVTGGVDTHKDTHTAAALDASGRLLGHREFAATAAGYAALLAWLGTLGQLVRVGVEGSGVYGTGLARFLQAAGVELVEVDRPDRKTRRWQGKSDPVDAEAAARAAQAGGPAVSRRPAAGRSTRCARCEWPAAPRWRPAQVPNARSRR